MGHKQNTMEKADKGIEELNQQFFNEKKITGENRTNEGTNSPRENHIPAQRLAG